MSKQAMSVTLDAENVTWLKGRVGGGGARSVSDLIDRIVTEARLAGRGPARSVIGTIEIDPSDPDLDSADDAMRVLLDKSLGRPVAVRERRTPDAAGRRAPKRRG